MKSRDGKGKRGKKSGPRGGEIWETRNEKVIGDAWDGMGRDEGDWGKRQEEEGDGRWDGNMKR